MKIVADDYLPLVEHYFRGYGELVLKPGRSITRSDVEDADILLIRSVTQVNRQLLENTRVQFVGSATTGADHLDIEWLDQCGIQWSVAEGCNSVAVSEYVVCVIAALQKMHYLTDKKIRAGVVGVGRIGELVVKKFKNFGWEVVLCDPFRTDIQSVPFEQLTDLDIISFHTPLTHTGPYPTRHLVENNFLGRQKKNCILLNAGRGEVFSFDALKQAGSQVKWCLDVWEGEPHIDPDVLDKALIATPHIAGHSLQGKYRGVEMLYHAMLARGILDKQNAEDVVYPVKKISVETAKDWRDVVLNLFDPAFVTTEIKNNPKDFDVLRKRFADRYEFGFVELENIKLPEEDILMLKWFGCTE